MGVLDVLSGLANAAGQGYAGYAQDQQLQVKQALEQAKAQQDAERNRVLNLISNRDLQRLQPGDPGYAAYKANEIAGTAPAAAAAHALDITTTAQPQADANALNVTTSAQAKADAGASAARALIKPKVEEQAALLPGEVQKARDTAKATADFAPPIATQDRPGDPTSPVTYKTRSEALGTGKAPGSATGGGSVSAQTQQARLLAAVSEARLADERMRTYEDKLLNGSAKISPLEQAGGSLTTNLSDSHSVLGALTQAGSEFSLNKSDSEYAQYLRDAATIGRAEQMMSPRGGNETMVRANALLSRAGTGAMANTIDASRMARQALFGHAGGVSQALTPTQNANLDAGVQKIKGGEAGGNIDLSAPPKGDTTVINGKTYVLPP